MLYKTIILLKTFQEIDSFVKDMCKIPDDIKILAVHNDYVVDARSIFGMLSLNLTEPTTIKFINKAVAGDCDDTDKGNNSSEMAQMIQRIIFPYEISND